MWSEPQAFVWPLAAWGLGTRVTCEPNTANRHEEIPYILEKFIHVQTLCMIGLVLFGLVCGILWAFLGFSFAMNCGYNYQSPSIIKRSTDKRLQTAQQTYLWSLIDFIRGRRFSPANCSVSSRKLNTCTSCCNRTTSFSSCYTVNEAKNKNQSSSAGKSLALFARSDCSIYGCKAKDALHV